MLNWTRVEELRDEVGEDAFAEVVELFLEEVSETLTILGSDPGELENQLHFLKGASLNLGFDDFSDICYAGEKAAREGRADEIDITAIHDTYAKVREVFFARAEEVGFLAA